jgi:hypothetical protein
MNCWLSNTWVAQMELEGMKERLTMGVKARLRAGKVNTGQDRYGYVYSCSQLHPEHVSPDCHRHIGSKKAHDNVWQKVCKSINRPEILLDQAHKMVKELRANADSLGSEQERIQNELDAITLKR